MAGRCRCKSIIALYLDIVREMTVTSRKYIRATWWIKAALVTLVTVATVTAGSASLLRTPPRTEVSASRAFSKQNAVSFYGASERPVSARTHTEVNVAQLVRQHSAEVAVQVRINSSMVPFRHRPLLWPIHTTRGSLEPDANPLQG